MSLHVLLCVSFRSFKAFREKMQVCDWPCLVGYQNEKKSDKIGSFKVNRYEDRYLHEFYIDRP